MLFMMSFNGYSKMKLKKNVLSFKLTNFQKKNIENFDTE